MNYLKITFAGRMPRKTYWLSFLVFMAASFILQLLAYQGGEIGLIIASVATLYLAVLGWSYGVRRLHDMGKSGYYVLISLIPIVGAILLILALVKDSVAGENEYGPNPKGIN